MSDSDNKEKLNEDNLEQEAIKNKPSKLSTIQKRAKLNEVFAMDQPGPGGAHHKYFVVPVINDTGEERRLWGEATEIQFQCGARKDPLATHGVLDGDLLEIVRNRLTAFQAGPYATEYNAQALIHVEEALMWLNRRVEDRLERDVLGTMEK